MRTVVVEPERGKSAPALNKQRKKINAPVSHPKARLKTEVELSFFQLATARASFSQLSGTRARKVSIPGGVAGPKEKKKNALSACTIS